MKKKWMLLGAALTFPLGPIMMIACNDPKTATTNTNEVPKQEEPKQNTSQNGSQNSSSTSESNQTNDESNSSSLNQNNPSKGTSSDNNQSGNEAVLLREKDYVGWISETNLNELKSYGLYLIDYFYRQAKNIWIPKVTKVKLDQQGNAIVDDFSREPERELLSDAEIQKMIDTDKAEINSMSNGDELKNKIKLLQRTILEDIKKTIIGKDGYSSGFNYSQLFLNFKDTAKVFMKRAGFDEEKLSKIANEAQKIAENSDDGGTTHGSRNIKTTCLEGCNYILEQIASII